MLRDSIKTDCQSCRFLNHVTGTCEKDMNVVEHQGHMFTLGYCREYIHKLKPDIKVPFKFDLFILFDEDVNDEEDLRASIEDDKHFYTKTCGTIHILDISMDRQKNTSVEFFKKNKDGYDLQVHCFLEQPGPYAAIYDVSRKLSNSCNYFLVIPAGKRLLQKQHIGSATLCGPVSLDILSKKTKVLHWNFPTLIDGDEQIIMLYTGLYLKQPFLKLGVRDEPYPYTLKEHELATGMQLSWLVSQSTIE